MKQQVLRWSSTALMAIAACTPRVPDNGIDDDDAGGDVPVEPGFLVVPKDPRRESPVSTSPDETHVAIGQVPPTLVRLTDGVVVPSFDGVWQLAFLEPDTDRVLLWDAATNDVDDLGVAVAMQQDAERVWIQRGPVGPFVVVDKSTLVERHVADVARDLQVTPTYATLVIGGTTTVIWPVVQAVEIERHFLIRVAPTRVVIFGGFDDNVVVERESGEVRLPGFIVTMTAEGAVVYWDLATNDLLVLDVDGGTRILCPQSNSMSPYESVVECGESSPGGSVSYVVDIASGEELLRGEIGEHILPARSNVAAYAVASADRFEMVFGDRVVSTSRGVGDRIAMSDDGRVAHVLRATGPELFSADASTSYLHTGPAEVWFRGSQVLLTDASLTATVVSAIDLTTTHTDPLVQFVSSSTDELFTLELPPGETRPMLRLYRAGQPRLDVSAGVDRIASANHGTVIVMVDEPGDPTGRNGTWAIHVDEAGE